jgi:hypothetical protein
VKTGAFSQFYSVLLKNPQKHGPDNWQFEAAFLLVQRVFSPPDGLCRALEQGGKLFAEVGFVVILSGLNP